MLIAIDGAQSTGKTTLFDELRHHFGPRFHYSREPSRLIATSVGIRTSSDWRRLLASPPELERFFTAEERLRSADQATHDDLIEDSSLYLIAAYRHVFGLTSHGALRGSTTT